MSYGLKICSSWKAGLAAAVACLGLISCGGGGGDAPITTPTPEVFEGNWKLFVTSEGVQTDTGVTSPGKDVPTAQTVSQLTVADFSGALVPAVTVNGYTVTVTGNTIRITGPNTDYSVTVDSFSITNYQSCGACGVGSEVSFQLDFNVTEGGTFDGNVVPTTTNSGSAILKWVRVN